MTLETEKINNISLHINSDHGKPFDTTVYKSVKLETMIK